MDPDTEEEDEVYVEDDDHPPSDEEEGEDLMENAEADYQAIPELDTYDTRILDNREYADDPGKQRVFVRSL